MPPGHQLHIGEHPDELVHMPFLTDEDVARRLHQLENGLAHIEATLPMMRREVAVLAAQFPKVAGDHD